MSGADPLTSTSESLTARALIGIPPRLWHALLVQAPILVFLFVKPFFADTDPDYWWHFKTGELIWQTRSIPRVDMFSFRAEGQPWVAHEWLSELMLYLVQDRFGYVGNAALFALIGVATGLAVYSTCRVRGVGEMPSALLMVLAFMASLGSNNVRPQMLTALLLTVYALLLTRHRQGKPAYLFALPVLMGLWVNLHGGYVIGLMLLGLAALGELADAARTRNYAATRPLLLAGVATALAALVNPHGVEALIYPFTYAGTGNASMRYISEWQSPNFHQPMMYPFALMLVLALALGIASRPARFTDLLWGGIFSLLALQSARHVALFAVVMAPILGHRLVEVYKGLGLLTAQWRKPKMLLGVWPAMLLLVVAVVLRPDGPAAQLGREPSADTYPRDAAQYLADNPGEERLFNVYQWGGYLLYELYPERQVFVDGRADVYGDELIDEYVTVARLGPGWRDVLERWQVELVLVERNAALATVLAGDPGWELAHEGEIEALYRVVP